MDTNTHMNFVPVEPPVPVATVKKPKRGRRFRHAIRRNKKLQLVVAVIVVIILVIVGVIVWRKTHEQAPIKQPASAVSAQYAKQLDSLAKAVDKTPKSADARKNYAVALYATGDPAGAAKQYEAAVKINPKDADAYNSLGNAYRDTHNVGGAVKAYQQAIKLASGNINAYANLASVQLYTQKDTDAAIATYKQGLKALPNNSQLQLLLGLAYQQAGNTAAAKQTYQAILAHDPTNAAASASLKQLDGSK